MNLPRFSLPLFLLLVPAAAHCEPAYEAPPPGLPASPAPPAGPGDPPPPPPPYAGDPATDPNGQAAGTAEGAGAGTEEPGTSAEGEVAIGADEGASDGYEDNDPAALTDFRPALDPYGTWVDDPTYGTVWVPSEGAVGADFHPYVSSGHWVYDDDWVWASDYSWGWAPFHYGRWVLIEGRGWSWIPGRTYRGAWVDWSVDDGYGYLGWAPAPPLFIWFGGSPVPWRRGYLAPRWVYCPRGAIFAPGVGARLVVGPAAVTVASHMRIYASTSARLAGPTPARFGYAANQIPHPSGEVQAHLARAQQFSRPSTAQPLGARAPMTRVPSGATAGARPGVVGSPAAGRAGGIPGGPTHSPGPIQHAPAARPNTGSPGRAPGGGFHGGGGGHHR